MYVDVYIAYVFLGLCLYWPCSLLVALRPDQSGALPPPPATFPLPAPACWVLGRAEGEQEARGVLWKWAQRHDVVLQSHCPLGAGGEREGGRGAELCP